MGTHPKMKCHSMRYKHKSLPQKFKAVPSVGLITTLDPTHARKHALRWKSLKSVKFYLGYLTALIFSCFLNWRNISKASASLDERHFTYQYAFIFINKFIIINLLPWRRTFSAHSCICVKWVTYFTHDNLKKHIYFFVIRLFSQTCFFIIYLFKDALSFKIYYTWLNNCNILTILFNLTTFCRFRLYKVYV